MLRVNGLTEKQQWEGIPLDDLPDSLEFFAELPNQRPPGIEKAEPVRQIDLVEGIGEEWRVHNWLTPLALHGPLASSDCWLAHDPETPSALYRAGATPSSRRRCCRPDSLPELKS